MISETNKFEMKVKDMAREDNIAEEDLWADMDSKLKEIINFDLLTDEQRIKAIELAMSGYLAQTKYIHEVTGMGLKCSKIYYDLYIKPALV